MSELSELFDFNYQIFMRHHSSLDLDLNGTEFQNSVIAKLPQLNSRLPRLQMRPRLYIIFCKGRTRLESFKYDLHEDEFGK